MARETSGICGKVLTIVITLAMLFSSGFVFTENATAEPIEPAGDSTPPVPPFMIWGTIFDANDEPVPVVSVLITNLRTSESLNANVYENGAYDAELEDLQYYYSIGDEIEITATIGENMANKIIIVKQIGFGERVDIHFEESSDSFTGENELAHYNSVQSNLIDSNAILDIPVKSTPEPRTPENSQTIYIDSPVSVVEEPEPDISLTDIRCPPYFRLVFTEKENNIRMTLKNDGQERRIIIVDLYHIEPDGVTESFLRTVHFGTILPGQTKMQDAWEKCTNMWTPTQRGRNWIRGEIYIKDYSTERILINEFKESFNIVPGWRPVMHIQGDWHIIEPTIIENKTVIIDGNVEVNAPTEIIDSDIIAGDLTITDPFTISSGSAWDMAATSDGKYKVQVTAPNGIINIYGNLTNNPDTYHYWFYMNGTLLLTKSPLPTAKPGIVENVMGSPDLSQPGGIICTSDNVRIENGAEVRYGKTHGVWLEGSNANISGAKIHDNGGNGIVCRAGAEPTIERCNISWNVKSGIDVENSNPLIQNNNSIQWNRVHGINILNIENSDAKIEGNTINNNFGSGIWCTNANATIANNTISSNGKGLIYREDVEQDNGWTSTELWHRVCNESGQAPYYNLSHEGDWSWWYGQDSTGDYDTGDTNYGALTSPQMNFATMTSSSLVFWSWYETDTQGTLTDHRNVTIYGVSKTTVFQLHGETMREWTRYVFDISDFVGQVITIEFSFNTNGTLDNDNQGWYLDDIEIIGSYPTKEGHGVHIVGGNQIKMTGNNISMNNWNGIYAIDVNEFSLDNCSFIHNKKAGTENVDIVGNANIRHNSFIGSYYGIFSLNSRLLVENNSFSETWIGLGVLTTSFSSKISNNIVTENRNGMYLQSGNNLNIENNTVFRNSHVGIVIVNYHNLTLLNCNISNNGFDSFSLYYGGVQIGGQNFNLKIYENNFSEHMGRTGVMFKIGSGSADVFNNTFINSNVHFDNHASGNINIFNNAFEDSSTTSIYAHDSSAKYDIFNNIFFSEQQGGYMGPAIGICEAPVGDIFNNTISNFRFGIEIISGRNLDSNNIYGNTITDVEWGIWLISTSGTTIHDNLLNNNNYSIKATNSSAIISNNDIVSNDYGVYFENSSNNTIYHNSFIDNAIQAYDDTGLNQWHNGYPSGGNYWGDYTGTDAMSGPNQDIPGPDGIGDTPYTNILGGSGAQDRYPLTSAPSFGQFSIPIILGWNLISTPFIPCNTSIPVVLSSIDGQWDVVRYYNATDYMDPWKTYRVNGTANNLFNLDHTMGFWLYVTDVGNGFLRVEGRVPTVTSITLHEGWNLVGYPNLCETMTVANAFWGTSADHVDVFQAEYPYIREAEPTYIMKPGEGYWVRTTVDCVWTVDW